jgi:hypothetical protein
MSLFVHTSNQTLLWNVVNKNKMVNDYFTIYPREKDVWFKSIVQVFYERNSHRALNSEELLLLNKEVITYMIQNIKDKFPAKPQQQQPVGDQGFLKSYSITENKVEKIGNQFNEKQLEYNSLFDKKTPEKIEFGETQDKPLSNMDELIKKHMEEREAELKKYSPLPLVNPPIIQPKIVEPTKLKIDNTEENVNIHIEEIDNANKKSVTWLDDVTIEKLEKQQLEINELRELIQKLSDKINMLENKSIQQ